MREVRHVYPHKRGNWHWVLHEKINCGTFVFLFHLFYLRHKVDPIASFRMLCKGSSNCSKIIRHDRPSTAEVFTAQALLQGWGNSQPTHPWGDFLAVIVLFRWKIRFFVNETNWVLLEDAPYIKMFIVDTVWNVSHEFFCIRSTQGIHNCHFPVDYTNE